MRILGVQNVFGQGENAKQEGREQSFKRDDPIELHTRLFFEISEFIVQMS